MLINMVTIMNLPCYLCRKEFLLVTKKQFHVILTPTDIDTVCQFSKETLANFLEYFCKVYVFLKKYNPQKFPENGCWRNGSMLNGHHLLPSPAVDFLTEGSRVGSYWSQTDFEPPGKWRQYLQPGQ